MSKLVVGLLTKKCKLFSGRDKLHFTSRQPDNKKW